MAGVLGSTDKDKALKGRKMSFSVFILYTGMKKASWPFCMSQQCYYLQMCIEDLSVTDHAVRDLTGLGVRASSIWNNQSLH